MITLALVILILLALASVLDLKFKAIPSILLTGMLLAVSIALLNFGLTLSFGILAFLFAYLLYEADFVGGVADVKVISLMGLMIQSMDYLYILFIIVMVFGLLGKLFFRFILKKPIDYEMPFIPILLLVYGFMYLVGGLIGI